MLFICLAYISTNTYQHVQEQNRDADGIQDDSDAGKCFVASVFVSVTVQAHITCKIAPVVHLNAVESVENLQTFIPTHMSGVYDPNGFTMELTGVSTGWASLVERHSHGFGSRGTTPLHSTWGKGRTRKRPRYG
eukprot:GHVR01180273.1.p3 GENE.GHVR01180273.1~~GHVR01180273.1.p3  ORF type:complete len:134 (-),score=10.65 GHVR01180273.1:457-858(-)